MKKINLKSKVTKLYEYYKAACLIAVGIICGGVSIAISVASIVAIYELYRSQILL